MYKFFLDEVLKFSTRSCFTRFDLFRVSSLIFKSGTRFWLKFGASRRHEIIIETKCKLCYMIKNLSLSIDV